MKDKSKYCAAMLLKKLKHPYQMRKISPESDGEFIEQPLNCSISNSPVGWAVEYTDWISAEWVRLPP